MGWKIGSEMKSVIGWETGLTVNLSECEVVGEGTGDVYIKTRPVHVGSKGSKTTIAQRNTSGNYLPSLCLIMTLEFYKAYF